MTETLSALPVNASTMTATVAKTYQDVTGTEGSEKSEVVPLKPVLEIDSHADITQSGASEVQITGKARGFSEGNQLTVSGTLGDKTFTDTGVLVQADGTWVTTKQDIRTWPSGIINLTVSGRNTANVEAEAGSNTVTYKDETAPSVQTLSVVPNPAKEGNSLTVSVTFSELVTGVTATVGGMNVDFSGTASPSLTWTGVTETLSALPVNASTMTATVAKTYQDVTGTEGSEKSEVVPLKPVLEIDSHADIAQSGASEVQITGKARGFSEGNQLTVSGTLGDKTFTDTGVLVQADGTWVTTKQDIRTWPSGIINLTVSGRNTANVEAEAGSNTVTYKDETAPSVQTLSVVPNPAKEGNSLTVSVTFSELVTGVTATVGGMNVDFSGTASPSLTWTGVTETLSALPVNASTMTATVAKTYQDVTGTEGSEKSEVVPLKPVLEIDSHADIAQSGASEVQITGKARGFSEGNQLTVSGTLGDKTFTDTGVLVQADGTWVTTKQDIRTWPSGIINLTVSGRNTANVEAEAGSNTVEFKSN
ncbi:hypothetical protein B6A42_19235 [Vibrio coralliilyticus]|nr:hypothetical protein B6A42_19235 [Vibrio coralliilyticus]